MGWAGLLGVSALACWISALACWVSALLSFRAAGRAAKEARPLRRGRRARGRDDDRAARGPSHLNAEARVSSIFVVKEERHSGRGTPRQRRSASAVRRKSAGGRQDAGDSAREEFRNYFF